jgi:uncharacterized protein (TIGR02757 family)
VGLKLSLDALYAGFNHPESALDPIQIVRRYPRVDDREIVAFVAAGLAFGRVASVMNSVEAVCAVMGPAPAKFVKGFESKRDGARLRPIVHRWIRGEHLIALFVVLRRMLESHGSIETFFDEGRDDAHDDLGPALESFSTRALALTREPRNLMWFFSRPSTGGACKRLNLFLRWMIRLDGVDPGGWTRVPTRQLVVPLDTHTIRAGKCLRLTRRASPGWKMASEITGALRELDRDDPVRYDFSLCHLSMMGACGFGTKQRDTQCPLRGACKPGRLLAR